jgi:GTP pyrophosphokinase
MIRISDILDRMAEHNPEADLSVISRAYVYSARIHEGKVRLSGEPYLSHPLEVAGILADMGLDVTSVAAGLLHDVVEDNHAALAEIGTLFGPELVHLVDGVTKISTLAFKSSKERQSENIRKMILAMADDLRVILIKLADRVHNMRTIQFHTGQKQIEIARETLDIYAPIANRLGIHWIKKDLEDLSFCVLEPEKYKQIEQFVAAGREEREEYVTHVKGVIEKKMAENGLPGKVSGRYKHFYSIKDKMARQNLRLEDIYDLIAFRVILDTVAQCYLALGIVHDTWRPVPGKFKDYVANPKPNMYQSLHTTVVGPEGSRMEVQIRTWEMDKVARQGIAAHWSYKEGGRVDEKTKRTFAWIQNIVEHHKDIKDPKEFLDSVRIELFPDEIYVFTPAGEVIALPQGASPVDFAFAIHTGVGERCLGAKVNGRMVPLKHVLKTGDSVEIITQKTPRPSKDWLSFVKTAKARNKIRQWFKAEEWERALALGRDMCERTFRRHKQSLGAALKSEDLGRVLGELGQKSPDELLASVGFGKLTSLQVLRKFVPREELAPGKEETTGLAGPRKGEATVYVRGMDDILVRFGKCCNPVPGDPITGYITRGFGVTIHRANCRNAEGLDPERRIEVSWGGEESRAFPVRVHVEGKARTSLLSDISGVISKMRYDTLDLQMRTGEGNFVDIYLTVSVPGTDHLDRVIRAILKVPGVEKARRVSR